MNQKYRFMPDVNTGFLSDEDTKKYISRVATAMVALEAAAYVSASLLASVLVSFVNIFVPEALSSPDFVAIANNMLTLVAIYCVALPILLAILSPLPKVTPYREKLGGKAFFGGLCVSFFAMMLGSSLSNSVILFIENLSGQTLTNPVSEMVGQSSIWIDIVFIAILVPILEEILFRKILCDRLLPLGEGYAIVLSAAIFGFSHGNFFQFFYAFFVGLVFGLIYVKTGKLIYTVLYHSILNFSGSVVVTLLSENIDYDMINEMLPALEDGSATPEQLLPLVEQLLPLALFEAAIMGLAITGAVLLLKETKKKRIRLESGILPPPKKGRVANVMCTVGTAALVTVYVILFVLSIMPEIQL